MRDRDYVIADHEAIVRELAAKPMLKAHTERGRLEYECLMCDAPRRDMIEMRRPEYHETDCTWRRAKELYPS